VKVYCSDPELAKKAIELAKGGEMEPVWIFIPCKEAHHEQSAQTSSRAD